MRFSEEHHDDEMNRLPSSALPHVFVPIDEIPDNRPDPSEALMEKEEEGVNPETIGTEARSVANDRNHQNDLGRIPSYLYQEFKEIPRISSNGKPELSAESEKIVDALEEAEAREKVPTDLGNGNYLSDSHGKRGRKPAYKDRRKTPLA